LRLASILKVDELDLRFYEFLTPDRTAAMMTSMEAQLRELSKQNKKKPATSLGGPKATLEEEIRLLEIPPLPDEKKLWELGLENDAVVFFVYRTHPNTDWDEWECVAVRGLQEDTKKTLGSSAGQTPGGDGFDPVGTQAARAAAIIEEAADAQRRAYQLQQEEEAHFASVEAELAESGSL
jgi:hypothetical protein